MDALVISEIDSVLKVRAVPCNGFRQRLGTKIFKDSLDTSEFNCVSICLIKVPSLLIDAYATFPFEIRKLTGF